MKTIAIDTDINIVYVKASSFPEGILDAFKVLYTKVQDIDKRRQYGLSRPENGKIGYRAAIEELLIGEASSLGLESMQIPKGRYISIIVEDFGNKVTAISNAFNELLSVKGIDPNGYCVEYYINSTDVQCMVRLTDIIN